MRSSKSAVSAIRIIFIVQDSWLCCPVCHHSTPHYYWQTKRSDRRMNTNVSSALCKYWKSRNHRFHCCSRSQSPWNPKHFYLKISQKKITCPISKGEISGRGMRRNYHISHTNQWKVNRILWNRLWPHFTGRWKVISLWLRRSSIHEFYSYCSSLDRCRSSRNTWRNVW